jgi:hypothetical protein
VFFLTTATTGDHFGSSSFDCSCNHACPGFARDNSTAATTGVVRNRHYTIASAWDNHRTTASNRHACANSTGVARNRHYTIASAWDNHSTTASDSHRHACTNSTAAAARDNHSSITITSHSHASANSTAAASFDNQSVITTSGWFYYNRYQLYRICAVCRFGQTVGVKENR